MPLIGTSTSASAKGYGMLASGYPVAGNPSFNNVSLLLHGDGTNGAQNNTFLDSSTNALAVTRSGNATQGSFNPFGPNGWSGYFPTGNNVITATSTINLQFGTSDFTIECWVNVTASNPTLYNGIYSNSSTYAGGTVGLYAGRNGDTTHYSAFIDSAQNIVSTSIIQYNTWAHIALVRSSGSFKLFINGNQEGGTYTPAVNPTLNGGAVTYIGTEGSGNSVNGYISNFRVVKGTAVYTANFTPSTAPLTAITNTSLLTLQDNRFKDNSTNNFTLTPTGSPQIQPVSPFVSGIDYSPATHGGSAYFDTGSLTVNSTNVSVGSGDFTLEFLHYYDSSLTSMTLLDSRSDTGGSAGFALTIDNTNISIYTQSGYRINGTRPTANQWNHIALVRSGNNHNIYVNGTSTGTTYTAANNYSSTRVLIGENFSGGQLTKTYFSNLRLIKGTAVVPTPATLPTAPLTNIAGTALLLNFTNAGIFDSSAKNNLITAGSAQVSSAQVKFGTGSMLFNGTTSDYLSILNKPYLNLPKDFTVEFWVNFKTNPSAIQTLCGKWGTSAYSWLVQFNGSTNALVWTGGTGSGFGATLTNSWTPSLNTWYHIAYVRSGTTITGYVNGVALSTTATNNSDSLTSTANLGVGINLDANQQPFNGYIDDLRITNGVAVYTQNFTPYPQAFPNS